MLETPPASLLRQNWSNAHKTPKSSPSLLKRKSDYPPSHPSTPRLKRPCVHRGSDDRWIHHLTTAEEPEEMPEVSRRSTDVNRGNSEKAPHRPQTIDSAITSDHLTDRVAIKRKRAESDENEQHMRKRIRLEDTKRNFAPQLGETSSSGETQRSGDIAHSPKSADLSIYDRVTSRTVTRNAVDDESSEHSGCVQASLRDISPRKDGGAVGRNTALPSTWRDNSHLMADLIRPVEPAKKLFDEARFALDFYHAKELMLTAQEAWSTKVGMLVETGEYHQLKDILSN
ncbi:hypothetical protein FRC17_003596 [Serendipita sp. 399]|nr:hypothetical protein FRC17_003596 [Serendipita sp. 399]